MACRSPCGSAAIEAGRGGGGSRKIAATVSAVVPRRKAGWPEAISWRTQPREKRSLAGPDLLAPGLLGRHVAGVPITSAGLVPRPASPSASGRRDPEVEDLRRGLPGHEDVVGLEVAVDDALRVGGGEPVARSRTRVRGPLQRERAVGEAMRRTGSPSRSSITV